MYNPQTRDARVAYLSIKRFVMLPVIPIVVAVASAAVLAKRKLKRNAKKSNYEKLVRDVRIFKVPVDSDGNFNPDTILSNGNPLMFEFMVNDALLVSWRQA